MNTSNLNAATIGISCILAVMLLSVFQDATNKQMLLEAKNNEEIRDGYHQKRERKVSEYHVVKVNQVLIPGYTLSPKPPILNWQKDVNPEVKTTVFDRNQICVGVAFQGNFESIITNPMVCVAN